MSDLSDYLVEVARDRGIVGPRALARATGLSPGQAGRLLNGQGVPKAETLQLLADTLGLPYDRLRRLNGMRPETPPFVLPRQFDNLPARDRRLILNLGWTLLEARFGGYEEGQEGSPERRTSGHREVVEVDFSPQRVTETVWDPTKTHDSVTHRD